MKIEIRACELSDLDALQSIAYQTFDVTFRHMNTPANIEAYLRKAFNPARLEAELRDTASTFYFLYRDGALAGYLKINEDRAQTDLHDPTSVEIERIYVKEEFQGLGLGKTLVHKAIEVARQRNKRSLWLGVWEKNEKAIRFYERMGFTRFGTHDFFMGDERQTDFIMKVELKNQPAG